MSISQVVHSESDRKLRPVVGFIGIGRMGKPMAANILKAGY
ncbi:MAG: NAD(P)-binding domain-containing protein, partial [Candidatus Bathyarchaeia archaeon]